MYNLNDIKAIPCSDVANKYGIELSEKHGKLWGKLRSYEKTSSFNIDPKKNLWNDFGISKGGSVIDLVMELEGFSESKDAINKLAVEYGFSHEDETNPKYRELQWRPLTDSQYRKLGIQPERATMNFQYDLNKHTEEQLDRWNEKYAMPVKDLAVKYTDIYNKMLEKISMEKIAELRNIYFNGVAQSYDPANDARTKIFIKSVMENTSIELNEKVDLLERGTIKHKHKYEHLKVNFEDDMKRIEKQQQLAKEMSKEFSQEKVIEEMEVAEAVTVIEDEATRKKLIYGYKQLFNFNAIEHFSDEQIKALRDINRSLSNSDNKFLSIENFKKYYSQIGNKLENLENEYNKLINEYKDNPSSEWKNKANKIKNDISTTKEMFSKFSLVIEGIKDATLVMKNENIKQNGLDKQLSNKMEISL